MPRRTQPSPVPMWLSRAEAAKHLNVSVSRIKRWTLAGRLRVYRPADSMRGPSSYKLSDLDAFMHQSRVD